MRPSEIRRHVLADHDRFRRDLDQLELVANAVLEGLGDPVEALRVEAEGLLARLRTHMGWEESYLLPALRDADAWGAERAERLLRDHAEQSDLLDLIVARLRDANRSGALVATDVRHLVELLREDMREEEQDMLDERVLRDDIVAIDASSG